MRVQHPARLQRGCALLSGLTVGQRDRLAVLFGVAL